MGRKTSKLEITDICDEMSEDLRRELIKNQSICVSKIETILSNIELKDEIKRLESDLMFANKCLKTFIKYKEYLNEIRPKIEDVLNFREKLKLNYFEIQYKNMIKKFNESIERNKNKSYDRHQLIDIDSIEEDHNYCIKTEIIESVDSLNPEVFEEEVNSEVISVLENNNSSDDTIIESKLRDKNERTEEPKAHNKDILSEILKEMEISNEITEEEVNTLIETQNNSQTSVKSRVLNRNKVSQKEIESIGKEFRRIVTEKLECPVNGCEAKFWYQGALFEHLVYSNAHLNLTFDPNLKYGCKECSFRCDSLKWHIYHRRAHQLKCRFCSKEYMSVVSMQHHLKRAHSFKPQFKCSVSGCEQSFKNEYFKFRHMIAMHKIGSNEFSDEIVIPKYMLKRRPKTKENETKNQNTKRMKYSCDYDNCQYMTDDIKKLTSHKNLHKKYPNISYKCDYCDYDTKQSQDLKNHIKSKHSNLCRFRCKYCEKAYKTYSSLESHVKEKHRLQKCNHCEEVFSSSRLRKVHENGVHLFKHCCKWPGCNFVGEYEAMLTKHTRTHTGECPYVCDWPECDYMSKSSNTLKEHKYKHTGELPHSCPHCDKKFRVITTLRSHIKSRHKKETKNKLKTYACDFVDCTYVTNNQGSFKSHNYLHKKFPNKRYKCNYCEFSAFRLRDLNKHLKEKHSNELRFKCNKCEKAYKTGDALNNHKKKKHRHEFKCLYCEEVFTKQEKRKIHMNGVHTKENCCTWPGCSYVALNAAILKQHTYVHNGQSSIVCDWPDCGFMAKTNYDLRHHKYIHTGEQPYACNWPGCEKRFRTKPNLKEHLRMHNRDLRYACNWPGCEFRSYNTSIIRNHRYYRHTSKMNL